MANTSIAKQLSATFRVGSIGEIQLELQKLFSGANGKLAQRRQTVYSLWHELAPYGYSASMYVGQTHAVVINRLGSQSEMIFDFSNDPHDGDTHASGLTGLIVTGIGEDGRPGVAPHTVLDRWRSLPDLSVRLVEETSSLIKRSNGRIARRRGDSGLDKYRLSTVFMFAVATGFLSANASTINGPDAIIALTNELNELNALNSIPYQIAVEQSLTRGSYVVHFCVNQDDVYRFKMDLAHALALYRHDEVNRRREPAQTAAGRKIATARTGQRAGDVLRAGKPLLPDMMIANSDAVRAARESRYAGEQIASEVTFRQMKEMLHTENGRAEAKRLIAVSLGMPQDSNLRDMLDQARQSVDEGKASAAMIAILLALI